jgi:uncharacterized protein YbjQ (UPF0145 family)
MGALLIETSDEIKEHVIEERIQRVYSRYWLKKQDAIADLKLRCAKLDANAVISFRIEEEARADPHSARGIDYYTVYYAGGEAVRVREAEKVHEDTMNATPTARQPNPEKIYEEIKAIMDAKKTGKYQSEEIDYKAIAENLIKIVEYYKSFSAEP